MSVSRDAFLRKMADARQKASLQVRPRITTALRKVSSWLKSYSDLFSKRALNLAILDAGRRHLRVWILYEKITGDRAIKAWRIEPYSYRYRWLTAGGRWKPPRLRKVLFGFDTTDKSIKMFVKANIQQVIVTESYFRPQWPVEIR